MWRETVKISRSPYLFFLFFFFLLAMKSKTKLKTSRRPTVNFFSLKQLFPVRETTKPITLYAEKWRDSIPISTHAMKGREKCSLLQAELKGLMDRTAYLISKTMWILRGSVSCRSGFCRHTESLSLASTSRGETDIRDGREGRKKRGAAATSMGFTVAMETVSSLLNTCFWWHHGAGSSTHSEGFVSTPNLNPETGPLVRVCVGAGRKRRRTVMSE